MNLFENILFDENFDQLNNMIRWNGMHRIKDETVAHHSFLVTWFSRILVEEIFDREAYDQKLAVMTYAAFHDFDEMFTGDINHNVKYNKHNGKQIRQELDSFVDNSIENLFGTETKSNTLFRENFSMKHKYVKLIVKVADWLSMAFYIKKEMELGNVILKNKYQYCIHNLNLVVDECIDYYQDNSFMLDTKDLGVLFDLKTINWKYND